MLKILRCPECGGLLTKICYVRDLGLLKCEKCGKVYPIYRGIIILHPVERRGIIGDTKTILRTILEKLKFECNVKLD